jgi:hypothetical protein
VVALRWLHPKTRPYGLGVVCLVLAAFAGWLGGPDGSFWIGDQLLRDSGYRYGAARTILALSALGLLLGWHLLATSVARWWIGIPVYLGIGLLCGAMLVGSVILQDLLRYSGGDPPVFHPRHLELIPFALFLWLALLLQMLQVFGWRWLG